MNGDDIANLKTKLKKKGAKTSGNKAVLKKRLEIWERKNLDRTLLPATTVPSPNTDPFDLSNFNKLKDLDHRNLEWFNPAMISIWFSDRMAQTSETKGRKLFLNLFLKNLQFKSAANDLFFRSLCSAETKKSVDYIVLLHLNNKERSILKATCECPAGAGLSAACKHVAALAYGVECYALTGSIKENISCTEMLQEWHRPKPGRCLEKISVDEVLGISTSESTINSNEISNINDFTINMFINNNASSALLNQRSCNVIAYTNDHDYCKEKLEVIWINQINNIGIKEQIKLEKRTRKQTKLWYTARKSRITASIAHQVYRTCKTKKYASSFLKNHINGIKIKAPAISWGLANEDTALKAYIAVVGESFEKCGIFIDNKLKYLSATPDGINDDKTCIVEIKCPYSVRLGKPTDVSYLKNGKLSTSHQYYTQTQIQMHVTNIHSCDFVVWTPNGIYIENIKYNAEMVQKYLSEIDFYFKNVFAPLYVKLYKKDF